MEPAIIKRCTLAEIEDAPNLQALLAEYGVESSIDGLGGQNMQGETYKALESTGLLHIVGAWVGDELAGFIAVLDYILPHYGKRVCASESYFVASAHRKSGAGVLLRQEAERFGEEQGAVGMLMSAPVGGRLAAVLPACGYRRTNEVFFKPLGQIATRTETLPSMTSEAVGMVREAENRMRAMPQINLPVSHSLHAGMYHRTVTIPAGVGVVGALIKIPTLLIVDGHCTVFIGGGEVTLEGHHVLECQPNRKQVFEAHSDTHLTMIFPTQAATVEEAENEFTDESALLQSRKGEQACQG